jgi:hypothetical protein
VDERLLDVFQTAGELVEADGTAKVSQLLVEECVPESGFKYVRSHPDQKSGIEWMHTCMA